MLCETSLRVAVRPSLLLALRCVSHLVRKLYAAILFLPLLYLLVVIFVNTCATRNPRLALQYYSVSNDKSTNLIANSDGDECKTDHDFKFANDQKWSNPTIHHLLI